MWSLVTRGSSSGVDDKATTEPPPPTIGSKMAAKQMSLQSAPIQILSSESEKPDFSALHAALHEAKYRIPSPTREQGDGMEAEEVAKATDDKVIESAPRTTARYLPAGPPKKQLITLPHTNIKLDKLPPITADGDVCLPAQIPANPLVQMTAAAVCGTSTVATVAGTAASRTERSCVGGSTSRRYSKEPKFVPYEPYKAAVTSILPPLPPSKSNSRQATTATRRTPSVASSTCGGSNNNGQASSRRDRSGCSATVEPIVGPLNKSASAVTEPVTSKVAVKAVNEDRLVAGILEEANDKIQTLESKLADCQKQLRIQTQVNHEVKKLLVASVGEDIQAKVDYLTQDKARLAADIRQYSNKICKDFEEKEKLSVESDLWKSKFLACSVIVDELARWKACLLQRSDDFDHHVRLLLHERSVLWNSLDQNLDALAQLKSAFDPLSSLVASDGEKDKVYSVLGLADKSLETATQLKERLLGTSGSSADQPHKAAKLRLPRQSQKSDREQIGTPAEDGLKELVAQPLDQSSGGRMGSDDYSTRASLAITGAARPHLAKMNDKLSSPNIHSSQFKCCTHCTGTVHVV